MLSSTLYNKALYQHVMQSWLQLGDGEGGWGGGEGRREREVVLPVIVPSPPLPTFDEVMVTTSGSFGSPVVHPRSFGSPVVHPQVLFGSPVVHHQVLWFSCSTPPQGPLVLL